MTTEDMARELAALSGESKSEAVRRAVEERLARERRRRAADIERRRQAIDAIVKRFSKLPVIDHRSADEILGYDEHGLPT